MDDYLFPIYYDPDELEIESRPNKTYTRVCLSCLVLHGRLRYVTYASTFWLCRSCSARFRSWRYANHRSPQRARERAAQQVTKRDARLGTRQRVLALLAQGESRAADMAAALNMTRDGVVYHLQALRRQGRVRLVGRSLASRWLLVDEGGQGATA